MKKPTLSKQASGPKTATAPPMTDADVAVATSVPRDVTARGLHSECVVCQDAEVAALTLLNCYHKLTGYLLDVMFVWSKGEGDINRTLCAADPAWFLPSTTVSSVLIVLYIFTFFVTIWTLLFLMS